MLTSKLVITLAFSLPAIAGVSPIGIASSAGDFQVGQVRMPGPATLYEGAVLETGSSPAQVSLRNGAIIRLSGGARATIHENSVLLERGVGQVDSTGSYTIQARSISLVPTSKPSKARLQVANDGTLQMAAVLGSFDVHRTGLASIGKLSEGNSLSLAPEAGEAGASAPAQFKGCLARSEKQSFLQLDDSKTVVTLSGSAGGGKSGDHVTVVGKRDISASVVPGTTEVVQALRVTVDGHGCSAKTVLAAVGLAPAAAAGVAGAAGTAAAGTGAATAGISTATIAIVGVAIAGAALIPTIALTGGSSSSSSISSSSR